MKPEYASANRNLRENKVYGSLSTGGSRAVRETGKMLQQAGASARERLIAAAAKRWNVPTSECAAAMSKVTHKPTGRTFRFGELAAEAAAIKLDKEPAIKRPDQFKFIGRRLERLDMPLKINGSAKCTHRPQRAGHGACGHYRLPGIRRHGEVGRRARDAGRRGVLQVVKLKNAVAVVADRIGARRRAGPTAEIEWEVGAAGTTDSTQFRKDYIAMLWTRRAWSARNDGNVDAAMATAAKVIEAIYDVPIIAHAPMEPLNAIAHVQPDRVDVWVGTQNADLALTFGGAAVRREAWRTSISTTRSRRRLRPSAASDEVPRRSRSPRRSASR